jgi:hypothetical protein
MRNRIARWGLWSACLLAVAALASSASGQQDGEPADGSPTVIRDGFETPKTIWRQEQTDATVKIYAQQRTNRAAHEGQFSEGFQFEAGIGGGLYYSYKLPNIPVTDDLKVSLYVRSNRTGAQILGRVVLPSDVDPDSRRPSFVLVPGTIYESSDRWQRLELDDMIPSIERQAKVLRSSTKRPVSLKGAYLERLVMNVYGGEGETEVYLDELTIGPVSAAIARAARAEPPKGPSVRTIADRPRGPNEPLEAVQPGLNSKIRLDRNRLTKDGYPWFFTAVRAPGADPSKLRRVGCDALVVPKDTDEATIRAAMASGMLLIPELTGPDDRTLPDADRLVSEATSFVGRDAVAFWSLAENLGQSIDLETRRTTLRRVRDAALAIRKAKPGGSPLTTGTVLGMLPEYARIPENLDVIGIPTSNWATTQEPFEMVQYLDQRRLLTARSNTDALFWATIDVTPPPIYQESIWGTDPPPSWGLPRVQPEQIRLQTYAALAGGCRGVCFRGDSDLTQEIGRPGLIEMALLNEEIDLLEPILADPDKSVRIIDTYLPDPPPPPPMTLFQMSLGGVAKPPTPKEFPPHAWVKAAAITTKDRRGTLLMVADYFRYSQYQVGQGAMNNLKLLVPVASDAHAYLISPGGVKNLTGVREPGGLKITLEDFGVTAIVLVTTNQELKDQIEQSVNRVRPLAVSLAIEQAELLRAWVVEINGLIQDRGHPLPNPDKKTYQAPELLAKSAELIKSAREALEREDYQVAWDEARRASRPLRILMRNHFMKVYDDTIKALKDEDLPCGPVAYPGQDKPRPRLIPPIVAAPMASFATLPQAWIWHDWIKGGRLGPNLVPNGNFTDPNTLKNGWEPVNYETEDVQTVIRLNDKGGADQDKKGRFLYVEASPRKGLTIDSLSPIVDHPLVAVRSPAVKVKARGLYRISVMVFMINPATPGAGGLIVSDSIGGERLQFRSPGGLDQWFELVYYRYVPADGTMSVTLGMANYGWGGFDDLKIQPITQIVDPDEYKAAALRRPRPNRTSTTTTTETASSRSNRDTAETETPSRPPTANRLQPFPVRE